jgi:ATP-dependent Lon protease
MNSDTSIPDGEELPQDEPAVDFSTFLPPPAEGLDRKILDGFPGLVVRKDLTKGLKQNAVVPTYVLEYLLGQHCATDDPSAMKAGLESVQRILAKHYVHRNQAALVRSTIKERGRHKVIDKLTVDLNDKGGYYEAEFNNLGIKKVPVADDFVRRYPKLLVGGIWCIVDVIYEVPVDPKASPWTIETLKPIQVAKVDFDEFVEARRKFSTEEWIDLLMQSIGFNPEMFTRRGKLLSLIRLIPYCERNYNLIELGPKGTGKSHIYAEFSPHGTLISGAEITQAKLFVNNSSGKLGLVGYWDCISFDEIAGKEKKVDQAVIDTMKNYMANKSFNRGIGQQAAESSMVFMGNTRKNVAYMLKHSHLFEALPDKYIDSAFLDRLHAYSPGWEVTPIRNDLFTNGYGFIVDYIAEILKHLRSEDFTRSYRQHFEIVSEVSTRDETGFEKTFSGLMKIIYPHGEATADEMRELLYFSMECRRRVREHILRIDDTFKRHDFVFRALASGEKVTVITPEEIQYPAFSAPRLIPKLEDLAGQDNSLDELPAKADDTTSAFHPETPAQTSHIVVPENSKGWSYKRLFAHHLKGASEITIRDPYVRMFFQVRNLMEFLQMVHEIVEEGDEVKVHLVTQSDPDSCVKQEENLNQLVDSFTGSRVAFSWELDHSPNFHARNITTDSGWKIVLDRGLDIFQKYETGPFSLEQAMQEARLTRGAEVTYLRTS